MMYKTITLELLQQRLPNPPQMPLLDRYSALLQASHEEWIRLLSQQRPQSNPSQIASEAMELAVKDLKDQLESEIPEAEDATLSLDDAMRFLRRHTPPA